MIDVIIVEDEIAIARGLAALITRNYPDFQVLALCRNGKNGLQEILKLKPTLVFVDINMPVMDGLEMITRMNAAGVDARCIILTGYAEFEFARRAVRLGVSDYLLKPISPDTLGKIMISCRQQQHTGLRLLQSEYLKRHIAFRESPREGDNPLTGYSCTFLILFYGPICSTVYNETIICSEIASPDPGLLRKIQEDYKLSVFCLPGHHCNETIYSLVSPKGYTPSPVEIARSLYDSMEPADTFLHIIISPPAQNGVNIYDLIRDTYAFAVFNNTFGDGGIREYREGGQDQPIHVSREIKQICGGIPEQPRQHTLYGLLQSMLSFWKEARSTQFQVVTDLRYFVSKVIHDYTDENIVYPDAAEIVSVCQSYEELHREIQSELERIYRFNDISLEKDEQSLAHQVRNWLDKNFTTQITYKIFQDIFGHNEKYLSTLFKAEFGISPSKYIAELRLDMAKKLMQSNPDILLKDVAEMIGFSDAFYFSRVFKAHEGISPSLYLKEQKGCT